MYPKYGISISLVKDNFEQMRQEMEKRNLLESSFAENGTTLFSTILCCKGELPPQPNSYDVGYTASFRGTTPNVPKFQSHQMEFRFDRLVVVNRVLDNWYRFEEDIKVLQAMVKYSKSAREVSQAYFPISLKVLAFKGNGDLDQLEDSLVEVFEPASYKIPRIQFRELDAPGGNATLAIDTLAHALR